MSNGHPNRSEAERQLSAAIARHRELVASSAQGGRSVMGDSTAAAAVSRGAALVAYALQRARAAGVDVERLADVAEWEPDVVHKALERGPEPVLAVALPDGADPDVVSRAEAGLDSMAKIDRLLGRISGDVMDPGWSPTPVELDDLRDRLEQEWRAWRQAQGRRI